MKIYADTSFLIAVYLQDAHSREAYNLMAQHPSLPITPFGRAEVANAIYRQVFLQRISAMNSRTAWENFELDCRSGLLQSTGLPETTWSEVIELARRYGPTLGVRTLDSLHVACALELRVDQFWTFDERQAKLAEAVGLDVTP
ncbi:MAG: type II toxin-antitoxin system VapC family toxin [Terracidiphilus sp.]